MEVTKQQHTEQTTAAAATTGEHAIENAAAKTTAATNHPAKRRRPLAGFVIAGASLALLFGIAALKGRVTDDNTDSERGLQ